MTIKKYFEVAENIQSLANKSAADIGSEVESVGYHEQDIIEEEIDNLLDHIDNHCLNQPIDVIRYNPSAILYLTICDFYMYFFLLLDSFISLYLHHYGGY